MPIQRIRLKNILFILPTNRPTLFFFAVLPETKKSTSFRLTYIYFKHGTLSKQLVLNLLFSRLLLFLKNHFNIAAF